jgi:hypothetical protein
MLEKVMISVMMVCAEIALVVISIVIGAFLWQVNIIVAIGATLFFLIFFTSWMILMTMMALN